MNKLIKKVLTDAKVRNAAALSAFVVTVSNVGIPWSNI